MKKLLSLPPGAVEAFHQIKGVSEEEWFYASDPADRRLGSGGGTAWLLEQCRLQEAPTMSLNEWLAQGKRLLIHSGGAGRRLPAYAPSGKILTPIPMQGQWLSGDLLSLATPFYETLLDKAPAALHTLVASGDVHLRYSAPLPNIPAVDVVCCAIHADSVLTRHGVFVMQGGALDFMLQKPSMETLNRLQTTHTFLLDVGVWLLSDRAVQLLAERSKGPDGKWQPYDLYGTFGPALGAHPQTKDEAVNSLTVAILPLPGGAFFHYGTGREMLASTLSISEEDKQRAGRVIQNAAIEAPLTDQIDLWIENSYVGSGWRLNDRHILTGIPANDWQWELPSGVCIDIVPIGEKEWAARPYGFDDVFAEPLNAADNRYMGQPFPQWLAARGLTIDNTADLQDAPLFPVFAVTDNLFAALRWMTIAPDDAQGKRLWQEARKLSANDLLREANLQRLFAQRRALGIRGAFARLRESLTGALRGKGQSPRLSNGVIQSVEARCAARMDLAGGWTDTPPYCLTAGGNVVNVAIELDGQMPLRAQVEPLNDYIVALRSVDLNAAETVRTWDELRNCRQVGSPFSIPKAALALAGFVPEYCADHYDSLHDQLRAFGAGIAITLQSAVPAGSGLGASSILAATLLGALSEFCALEWDKNEIGCRTLALEQLLTTGGGWQDPFGGLIGGLKLLQTDRGLPQIPQAHPLPDRLFSDPDLQPCHLLYYTGLTRTAKTILAEIVQSLFLGNEKSLRLLADMKAHALETADAIRQGDFQRYGQLVGRSWEQNKALDAGATSPDIERLIAAVSDFALGCKLPGAGGGGFLYIVAKDPTAAARIHTLLADQTQYPNVRAVNMSLSPHGLQVNRRPPLTAPRPTKKTV